MADSSLDGSPVAANVERKSGSGQAVPIQPIGSSGYIDIDETTCDFSVLYNASPKDQILFVKQADDWQACDSTKPVEFKFTPTTAFAAIAPIVNRTFPDTWAPDKTLFEASAIVDQAIASKDFGTASALSVEYSNLARSRGNSAAADGFRILALQAGAVGSATAVNQNANADFLYDDPQQKMVVLAPNSVDTIKAFQKFKGVKQTGNIDWSTMTALAPPGGFKLSTGAFAAALQ